MICRAQPAQPFYCYTKIFIEKCSSETECVVFLLSPVRASSFNSHPCQLPITYSGSNSSASKSSSDSSLNDA